MLFQTILDEPCEIYTFLRAAQQDFRVEMQVLPKW